MGLIKAKNMGNIVFNHSRRQNEYCGHIPQRYFSFDVFAIFTDKFRLSHAFTTSNLGGKP